MAYIDKAESNGGDTLFKLTGYGFGTTQATFAGLVKCSTAIGSSADCPITTWSDTVITGSLPSGYANPGVVVVVVKHTDGSGNLHSFPTNRKSYTIT